MSNDTTNFDYPTRRVAVTGADGFIGSHLVDALLERGAAVVAIVRRASRSQVTHDFTNLRAVVGHPRLSIITVDLAGPSALPCLMRLECDVWFHLAADAYVPASFSQPGAVVHNNVTSTLNVLEAATALKPRNVVIASSSEVYGPCKEALSESDPLNPTTPYAASKVACDRLASSYNRTFGTPVTIVRPFNTYGPRHVYDVVPLFLRAALQGAPLKIHGDGSQTRDLTYVSDQVAALLALGAREGRGELFNSGTGQDYSILHLAEVIKSVTGSSSPISFIPARLGEVSKLLAQPRHLMQATGWRPLVDLVRGIELNAVWARSQGWGNAS